MSQAVISFEDVRKGYTLCHHLKGGIKTFLFHLPQALRQLRTHSFWALDGLSFEVQRGSALGIIGANGAGKSTTLALLAGVIHATSGSVEVRGQVCPLLELGAGFHPELSGRENIMLNGVLMGLTRRLVRQRMEQIIDFSELGDFIEQPVRTYSGGMLGRLGFSVAAHLDMDVLLVDEVLAVGDASFQAKCIARMRQFRDRGVTMVFVSHDMNAVGAICDQALWLDKGKRQMQGEPKEVVTAYLAAQAALAEAKA